MNILETFVKILSSHALLSAVFSTVFVIGVGYYARKKELVPENAAKTLSSILLNLTLPALAFNAFMTNINAQTFTTGLSVFVFGFIAYVLLIVLSFVFFAGYKGDRKDTLRTLMIFGSTTFFGLPIINAVLPAGTLYANLFNIAYRVFLYSYGLAVMSGTKFDKKSLKTIFVNPIVIATFVGFAIWIFQGQLPQVLVEESKNVANIVDGKAVIEVVKEMKSYAFIRIDKTLPWVFRGFKYLGDLSSPLAWLAIGMTLASISLKEAVKEKAVWFYALIKLCVVPASFIAIMYVANIIGGAFGFNLSYNAVLPIVVMLATPPATVAVAYAISYDKESVLSSNASLLTSFLSVLAIIIWVVILSFLQLGGVFA